MTLRLDPPRCSGGLCVAAVTKVSVSAHRVAGGVVGHGRKIPTALVVHDGTRLAAFDLRGRPLEPDQLEKDCPGLIAAMESAVREDSDNR